MCVTKSNVSEFVKYNFVFCFLLKYFIHKIIVATYTLKTVQPEFSSDCEACSSWIVFDELCLETKREIFDVHSVSLVRVVMMTS